MNDTMIDAAVRPPQWYGPDWAPEGDWFYVPNEVRAQYAALGDDLPPSAVRRFHPGAGSDHWVRASVLPDPLPPGVSRGAEFVGHHPPPNHRVGRFGGVFDPSAKPVLWTELVFADDPEGLSAWFHTLRLREAREAAAQAAAAARVKSQMFTGCGGCGVEVPRAGAAGLGGLAFCSACFVAAGVVLPWLVAAELLPDGRSRWEALAGAIAGEVDRSGSLALRAPMLPGAVALPPSAAPFESRLTSHRPEFLPTGD